MTNKVSQYMGVVVDYSRDRLIPEQGIAMLTKRGFYKKDYETSPQQSFARAAVCYSFGDYELAQRIYDAASLGWFTFASPVLSNAVDIDWPTFNRYQFEEAGGWLEDNVEPEGMPISCFLSYIPDTKEGLVSTRQEAAWLSMMGGGVGIYASNRAPDERSTGVMAHLKGYDADTLAYRQTACYLPETEVLTSEGWKRFVDVRGDEEVAVVTDNGGVTYEKPIEWVNRKYEGDIYRFYNENRGLDITVTANHNMVIERKSRKNGWSGEYDLVRADELKLHNEVRFLTSTREERTSQIISPKEKLLVAFSADGSYANKGVNKSKLEFNLSKERKITRLRGILEDVGYDFTEYKTPQGTTKFYVSCPFSVEKGLEKVIPLGVGKKLAGGYLMEISQWDSSFDSRSEEQTFTFSSTRVEEIDEVMRLCAIVGWGARKGNGSIGTTGNRCYTVRVTRKASITLGKVKRDIIPYNGTVACCVVSTGKIIVRAGKVPLVCGNTRRGSMAAFLDIDHPEIKAFISMRNPVGGDQNKKCFNLNNGVMITDAFMEAVISGEDYQLVDPKHGPTGTYLNARSVWEEIMELRFETGEPYLIFKDTINRNLPEQILHPLYQVKQSNLCSEITLMTSAKRTAVCCLSSLNLEMYDDWKDSKLVADLLRFLDNVLEYFIRLAPNSLERAVRSARKERAIGIGTLGWHSYLQKNNIPFESGGLNSAAQLTHQIYSNIKGKAIEASKAMAMYRGEAPDTEGSGYRNSHFMAIAPNASSSSLVGASPSVEPFAAVAYVAQGRAGSFLIKNKYFEKVLERYNKNTTEVWDSIIANDGSVQHLSFLSDLEKKVFKTAREINPQWIIELASIRQQHICQSQSINIFVKSNISLQEMSDLHMLAWKKGLKSLYYCRAEAAGKVEVGTGGEKPLNSIPVTQKINFETCLSCEG